MPDRFDITGKRIWIAGHTGLVGAALVRRFAKENCEVLTVSRRDLDLRDQAKTDAWIGDNRPDAVIIAAAKVGGIGANSDFPADFLFDNLAIAQNIIHLSFRHKVTKLVFLGSSCIYPKFAEQPIKEEALLTGELEPTNEAYAVAKIAGIKLCQYYHRQYGCDFISLMPCNIYGPNDHWNDDKAHVIPSLISKMHAAKVEGQQSVEIWGSGSPLREFLYVDDLADGIFIALKDYSNELHLNIGAGSEVSIRTLAKMIQKIVGFKGKLQFDRSKPDGTLRKLLASDNMRALGWKPMTSLEKGLKLAYEDFLKSRNLVQS